MLRPAIHQSRHGGRSAVQVLLEETKGGTRYIYLEGAEEEEEVIIR